MNSTTVAMLQLSNVEANGVKLDYLERVILKKYPQWKSLAFDYHNDDDFMDDLIDTISNFETDLESLRAKIIDGDSYDRKELDLGSAFRLRDLRSSVSRCYWKYLHSHMNLLVHSYIHIVFYIFGLNFIWGNN